jgi:hypothetical protein
MTPLPGARGGRAWWSGRYAAARRPPNGRGRRRGPGRPGTFVHGPAHDPRPAVPGSGRVRPLASRRPSVAWHLAERFRPRRPAPKGGHGPPFSRDPGPLSRRREAASLETGDPRPAAGGPRDGTESSTTGGITEQRRIRDPDRGQRSQDARARHPRPLRPDGSPVHLPAAPDPAGGRRPGQHPQPHGSLPRIPSRAWVDRVGGRRPLTLLLGLTLVG